MVCPKSEEDESKEILFRHLGWEKPIDGPQLPKLTMTCILSPLLALGSRQPLDRSSHLDSFPSSRSTVLCHTMSYCIRELHNYISVVRPEERFSFGDPLEKHGTQGTQCTSRNEYTSRMPGPGVGPGANHLHPPSSPPPQVGHVLFSAKLNDRPVFITPTNVPSIPPPG